MAAIWSATAYTLEQQKRRKEEEARARLEAERANAEARAREQAQREYQAALKAAEEAHRQDPNPWAGVDPETADMTEAEKLALYKQSPEYQAHQARIVEWEEQQSAQIKATQSQVLTSAPLRTPSPTSTPSTTPTPSGTPTPFLRTQTPTLETIPTSTPTAIPTPQVASQSSNPGRPWWVSSSIEASVRALVRTIPSVKVNSPWRNPTPLWSIVSPRHAISFGTVTNGRVVSDANPNILAGFDKSLTITIGKQPFVSLATASRQDGFDVTVRNSWQTWRFVEDQIQSSLASSTTFRVTWGGFWNTTVGIDVNNPEIAFQGGGLKGRISSGWYLEYKPGRLITYGVLLPVAIVGVVAILYYVFNTGDTSIFNGIPVPR